MKNVTTFIACSLMSLAFVSLEAVSRKERDQQKLEAAKAKRAAQPATTMSKMNFEELKNRKSELVAQGYKEQALKYLEKMIPMCSDVQELGSIMLEYADLLFEAGNLIKAGTLFEQFTRLYPGNDKAEYANYKAILCSFYNLLESDRDQSKTKETIALAELFLGRPIFKEYASEVKNILKTCQETLLESELNIVNFYYKRGSYNAAQTRLACIEKEFETMIPNLKPRLLTVECEIALYQNNPELLQEKRTLLAQQYPDYKTASAAVVAQAPAKKTDFVARF